MKAVFVAWISILGVAAGAAHWLPETIPWAVVVIVLVAPLAKPIIGECAMWYAGFRGRISEYHDGDRHVLWNERMKPP